MNPQPSLSPFVELPAVLRGLLRGIASWHRVLSNPVLLLTWSYVSRLAGRMERLSARFVAGQAMTRASVVAVPVRPATAVAGEVLAERVVTPRIWPGRFGWLVRQVGWQAAGYASQLEHQLRQPEMIALLEASVQARRLMLPVCRMLGVDLALLRRPARAVVARVAVVRVRQCRPTLEWGRGKRPRGLVAWAREERQLDAARKRRDALVAEMLQNGRIVSG